MAKKQENIINEASNIHINEQENNEQEQTLEEIELSEMVHSYKALTSQIIQVSEQMEKWMALIRYKYEYYSYWNIIMNIIIILCSSVITFLESLRANIPQNDTIDFCFTIITLSFGFIIAFTLSLFKFLKIQDKMEETKSVLIGIEAPTTDVLIFLNDVLKVMGGLGKNDDHIKSALRNYTTTIKVQIQIGEGNKKQNSERKLKGLEAARETLHSNRNKWKVQMDKTHYPVINVNKVITQDEFYEYEKRYLEQKIKTKKMRLKRNLYMNSDKRLIDVKSMILNDMVSTNEELEDKYGDIEQFRTNFNTREEYWNASVMMTNKLDSKYAEMLGVKKFTKCCDSCTEIFCCCCKNWCKHLCKSVYYFLKCCKICCKDIFCCCSSTSNEQDTINKENRMESEINALKKKLDELTNLLKEKEPKQHFDEENPKLQRVLKDNETTSQQDEENPKLQRVLKDNETTSQQDNEKEEIVIT